MAVPQVGRLVGCPGASWWTAGGAQQASGRLVGCWWGPSAYGQRCLLLLATVSLAAAFDRQGAKPSCEEQREARRQPSRFPFSRKEDPNRAEVERLQFIVIGASGQGKSTVLNQLAGMDLFEVGAGRSSITQAGGAWDKKNSKEFTISDGRKNYTCRVLDTPGFPDPDKTKADYYYDIVVQLCRETNLNGVVLVVRPGREMAETMKMYEGLLKEFNKLVPPIVMLVNGDAVEKLNREDDGQFAKRKAKEMREYFDFGKRLEDFVTVREIVVSHRHSELAGHMKHIVRMFSGERAAKSPSMRTFAELREEFAKCNDEMQVAEIALEQARAKIGKRRKDIESLDKEIVILSVAAGVAAFSGNTFLPVYGHVTALVLTGMLELKARRVAELKDMIGDQEEARLARLYVEQVKAKRDSIFWRVMSMEETLGKK